VNVLSLDPVTTLYTCAGKLTFSDVVLPAALTCRQPSLDDARMELVTSRYLSFATNNVATEL